jgi:hypothetical protein
MLGNADLGCASLGGRAGCDAAAGCTWSAALGECQQDPCRTRDGASCTSDARCVLDAVLGCIDVDKQRPSTEADDCRLDGCGAGEQCAPCGPAGGYVCTTAPAC